MAKTTAPDTPPRRKPPDGAAIQARREELCLTRTDLAEMLDLSYQHIYNIERGHKGTRPETLHRIAAALNVHVNALIKRDVQDSGA